MSALFKLLLGLRGRFFDKDQLSVDTGRPIDSATSLRLRREPWALPGAANASGILDGFIAFVALERILILRGVTLRSRGDIVKAFSDSIRIYAVIIAHMWLYWAINRGMPGGISYLDYNAAAFAMWQIFSTLTHKGSPTSIGLPANIPLRIRWIHLFIGDFVWTTLKVLVGVSAVYGTFLVFPQPNLTGVISAPNFLLLAPLFLLSALLGAGLGMILQTASVQFPIVDAILEVVMWFLFVTSGIYESFVQLPAVVAGYFSFNPMMSIIEYGRMALDPGYPVDTLTLVYPVAVTFGLISLGFMFRRQFLTVETP